MINRVLIRSDRYHDSVTLMLLSQRLSALPGVAEAVAAMGTAMNRQLLENVGFLTPEAAAARPSDLVIAVSADSAAHAAAAIEAAEQMLDQGGAGGAGLDRAAGGSGTAPSPAPASAAPGSTNPAPRTIAAAVRATPDANLAFISVPGPYAAREARLALEHGLDVMLFSNNVPLAAEVRLKQLAHERGRLLMGPDCGTAIIDGVGLGFANAVRRGSIGIVAASGTGAQELSCLIDRLGCGISQLIGTGGRDLSPEVGGRMMLDGLARLQADPATKVIAVISKPPAPAVAERIQLAAQTGAKPAVFCFLTPEAALSIDDAAVRAVHLATGEPEAALATRLAAGLPGRPIVAPGRPIAAPGRPTPAPGLPPAAVSPARTDIRGLFAGGSLCDQALMILERALGPIACNVHPVPSRRCSDGPSRGHTLLDLGDDGFTAGRPHPMIDPAVRRRRLFAEAADPRTAVILLDIVLGHGAHADPAGALAGAIREAADQGIAVVASVTGTEADPQGLSAQASALREAGAAVLPTARRAAEYVLEVLARG